MTALPIAGVPRHYAWGSTTEIPRLLGVEPDGQPVAELWFGAHPDDPSPVLPAGLHLEQAIAADPIGMLGADAINRFGSQLPFLMKILSAQRALSIQVHPDLDQARAGFAAENDAAVPHDAPERNYRDPNHKPELVCALTPFDGACGFRSVPEITETASRLELDFLVDALDDGLQPAFAAVLAHPDPAGLAADVLDRLSVLGADDPVARTVQQAAADFPDDVGIAVLLMLRPVRLEPGEAMFLDAGTVHCYLRGTAVEIMAASDNVLRCGLTPKHMDVPELLRIVRFAAGRDPRVPCDNDGGYPVPVPDFRLHKLTLDDGGATMVNGPAIVLCTSGRIGVEGVPLVGGRAAFVPADAPADLTGAGVAHVGTVASPSVP